MLIVSYLLNLYHRYPGVCSQCDPTICDEPDQTPVPTQSPVSDPPVDSPSSSSPGTFCGCEGCNYDSWHTVAGESTCGARIEFLMFGGLTEEESCLKVANDEFNNECGACNPNQCTKATPRCGCQECEDVWDVVADSHSCGSRITWLMTSKLLDEPYSESDACRKVSEDEFPSICGACSCPDDPSVPTLAPAGTPVTNSPTSTSPTTTAPSTASPTQPLPTTEAPTQTLPTPGPTKSPTVDDSNDFSRLIKSVSNHETLIPPKHIDQSLVSTRSIPTSKVCCITVGHSLALMYEQSQTNFSCLIFVCEVVDQYHCGRSFQS